MENYIHKVHYYETDKMGVTHHSNYIRWMEEARVHFLDEIGCSYARLEEEGVVSPVIGVECQYKHTTTFDDEVEIEVKVGNFTGIRLTIEYTMTNHATGALVLSGRSMHCFLDKNGRPVTLRRTHPEINELLLSYASQQ